MPGEGGSLVSCRDSSSQEPLVSSKGYKSQEQEDWTKRIPERDQVVLTCKEVGAADLHPP